GSRCELALRCTELRGARFELLLAGRELPRMGCQRPLARADTPHALLEELLALLQVGVIRCRDDGWANTARQDEHGSRAEQEADKSSDQQIAAEVPVGPIEHVRRVEHGSMKLRLSRCEARLHQLRKDDGCLL